ncbi:MAG: PucR family transcriptional regulator [Alkalibacterium sp.]|nr:PucR family transcriptional regulator [Alkalibacterium sp.]
MLKMKEVCQFNSLRNERILSGEKGLENRVTGAMVMEAIDIEEWGREGQVLLTSNYAFEGLTVEQINRFFVSANEMGIAGIIFKKNRLVNRVPDYFIENCDKYNLPLIEVNKKLTYEEIINEILKSLINRNALLLQSYYDNHQEFIQLMMNQAGIEDILATLNKLINIPVSLLEKVEGELTGTDDSFHNYTVQNKISAEQKEQVKADYNQFILNYVREGQTYQSTLIAFPIPSLGHEEYELLLHGVERSLSDMDFMAVTNTVIAIQTELVKRYTLNQQNKSRLNELVSDLMYGRLTKTEDVQEAVRLLKINPAKSYRIIQFYFKSSDKDCSAAAINRFTDTLVYLFNSSFADVFYATRQEKISFIVSADNLTISEIKRKVEDSLEYLASHKMHNHIQSHITISNDVSVENLSEGYRQAVDTQKIMTMWDDTTSIVSYQDLGLYQLFVETDNLESLNRFVPELIRELSQSNPDLLKTLYVFINTNQNYSEAADTLFVHPKTVRYRINRLKELYHIDFKNPEEMLRYNIAMRIIKLTPCKQ